MLEDAVQDLQAGKRKNREMEGNYTPQINLGLPVLIPETYVQELPVRLGLYRRIGAVANEAEIEAMAAELSDRFGTIPAEVENLLQVVALKLKCRAAGGGEGGCRTQGRGRRLPQEPLREPGGLVQWVQSQKGLVTLRPDHKVALLRELPFAARVKAAHGLVSTLAKVAAQARQEAA
jgi:transcription-repair coupling factor (superfamily II helicase)